MVLVKVFEIAAMMHAVMGGRVENEFEPARHFMNGFGMDPELVDETDLLHEQYPDRVKPTSGIHAQKRKVPVRLPGPGLAQCSGEIISLR